MTDWLRAERDLYEIPESEISETGTAYQLKIATPGFNADELAVTVDSNWIAVSETSRRRKEFAAGFQLFRRFELGAAIEVDQVEASLDDGKLNVTIPKAAGSREIPAPKHNGRSRPQPVTNSPESPAETESVLPKFLKKPAKKRTAAFA